MGVPVLCDESVSVRFSSQRSQSEDAWMPLLPEVLLLQPRVVCGLRGKSVPASPG